MTIRDKKRDEQINEVIDLILGYLEKNKIYDFQSCIEIIMGAAGSIAIRSGMVFKEDGIDIDPYDWAVGAFRHMATIIEKEKEEQ